MQKNGAPRTLAWIVGPGLLLAATGVGSGDLATASLVGSLLGPVVLWAVIVGALLKFIVTEGLARWQLATGETFLEGVARRLGPVALWLFLPYLLLWSFFVAAALMSACGVTLHAMFPVFGAANAGKVVFGMASSVLGLVLVLRGGFALFEKVMRACIGVMFATVLLTAALFWPGTEPVLSGLLIPRIPEGREALVWTVALIGGVGGTLTVLCYGYWLREAGRGAPADLATCRIDLAVGYLMTAAFGIAMVIVGSGIEVEGQGTQLLVSLSDRLGEALGPVGKWLFLVGTLGAVFSSLLGVWQAVPYLFADCWGLVRGPPGVAQRRVDTGAAPYRAYLVALALVPMAGLFGSFREMQKLYTVIGALFFPVLALALLLFNGRAAWIGPALRNRPLTVLALLGVLVLFGWMGLAGIQAS